MGLTGGIACGKSVVAAMLADRGARLIDADKIARFVVEPGHPGLDRVVDRFGPEILQLDGTLNRQELGRRIFASAEEREALDGILHPLIIQEIRERMERSALEAPDKLVVADVPLLYESGMVPLFDQVMVVYASPEVQVTRLMKRNGLSREEALQRIASQMPVEEKARRADRLIRNDGDLDDTERQVEAFWREMGLP
ncbi:dephospho-CoA kinase [Gorillibacterium sp. CAU 1737]|uniref:dephospho-CoA kinase n=1 Tax=Gorillibacterium sp. CAU 1737 TaxID=3140362 RepID=UPI0032608E0D